jgi:putative transposase
MAACCAILEAAQAATTSNSASFPTCHGPKYVRGTLMEWAENKGIALAYIQPGKPQQNAEVERYNRAVRHK